MEKSARILVFTKLCKGVKMEHLFHLDITNGLFTIVCSNCGSKLIKVTHDNCGKIKSCTCTKCSATMTRKENIDNKKSEISESKNVCLDKCYFYLTFIKAKYIWIL